MVSCVIVAFHRPQQLAGLLGALDDPRIERIVVNVDDDEGVAQVAIDRGAVSVHLSGNPGYAAAVNRGVAACTHDIVVFLNDDVTLTAADLIALTSSIVSGQADVAVPRLVTSTGETEPTIAAIPTPITLAVEWMALPDHPVALLRRVLRIQKWRRPVERERIDAAAAAVVACRRALIEEVPLPEAYFLYWEESEWFWLLARRGATVVIEPSVVARHEGGRNDVRAAKSRLLATNAVRCVRRTQGRFAGFFAWNVVMLWNARLVVVDGLRGLIQPRRNRVLRARWAGLRAAVGAVRELR